MVTSHLALAMPQAGPQCSSSGDSGGITGRAWTQGVRNNSNGGNNRGGHTTKCWGLRLGVRLPGSSPGP